MTSNTDLPKRRHMMTADDTVASKQRRRTVSDDDAYDNISAPTIHITGKPKRQVHFSSHSSLILYNDTHQQDYYDEEQVSTSWYTREEETLFKQLAKCEIQLLRRTAAASGVSTMNNLHEQLQISPVGLERSLISDEYTLRRANSRRQVSRAVFREQARQHQRLSSCQQYPDTTEVIAWEDECIKSIAKHAQRASEWSRAQAQVIGYFQAIANYPQPQSSKREDKQGEAATKEELVDQCKMLEHFVKAPRRVSERDLPSY